MPRLRRGLVIWTKNINVLGVIERAKWSSALKKNRDSIFAMRIAYTSGSGLTETAKIG